MLDVSDGLITAMREKSADNEQHVRPFKRDENGRTRILECRPGLFIAMSTVTFPKQLYKYLENKHEDGNGYPTEICQFFPARINKFGLCTSEEQP